MWTPTPVDSIKKDAADRSTFVRGLAARECRLRPRRQKKLIQLFDRTRPCNVQAEFSQQIIRRPKQKIVAEGRYHHPTYSISDGICTAHCGEQQLPDRRSRGRRAFECYVKI